MRWIAHHPVLRPEQTAAGEETAVVYLSYSCPLCVNTASSFRWQYAQIEQAQLKIMGYWILNALELFTSMPWNKSFLETHLF